MFRSSYIVLGRAGTPNQFISNCLTKFSLFGLLYSQTTVQYIFRQQIENANFVIKGFLNVLQVRL